MAFLHRDPDDNLVAIFKQHAIRNEAKSLAAGREIQDDIELCEVRCPGSRDIKGYPALAFSRWVDDPETGGQRQQTYAERFARQYQQFKLKLTQTKAGTPLTHAPFLTVARQAELRALNIYTVEQLASIDGQELKNLGQFGRDLKNKAEAFIDETKSGAAPKQLMAEIEALRAKNQLLEEDNEAMKNRMSSGEAEYEAMSLEALREFIRVNAGAAPVGQPNRRTLIRMAMECRPEKVA